MFFLDKKITEKLENFHTKYINGVKQIIHLIVESQILILQVEEKLVDPIALIETNVFLFCKLVEIRKNMYDSSENRYIELAMTKTTVYEDSAHFHQLDEIDGFGSDIHIIIFLVLLAFILVVVCRNKQIGLIFLPEGRNNIKDKLL